MVSAGFSPRQLMFSKLCYNSQKARMYWIVTVYIVRQSFTPTEPPQHPNQSVKNLQQFTALLLCVCACLCVVCECGICSCVDASLCACVNTCRGYGKTLPNDLLPYCLQTESPTERGRIRLSVSRSCRYFSVYPCHTTQGYRCMSSHPWIFTLMLVCGLKHSHVHSKCTCSFSRLASPHSSLYSKTPPDI